MLARAPDDALDAGPRKSAVERRCASTGAVKPVDDMIRFVIAPDGAVVADLKRRLPGRGVWITATRAALRDAIARKAFARSFKRELRVAPELLAVTEQLLERGALDALAIAYKARRVAVGFAKVEAALAHGEAVAVLHATDAAADGVRKLQAAMRRAAAGQASPAILNVFTSAQLDLALGRSNVIHAALVAGPESRAFLARAGRLEHFRTGPARNA
jgi:uncharacterized protein